MPPLTRIWLTRIFPFLILATLCIGGERTYHLTNLSALKISGPYEKYLYIPANADFQTVQDSLRTKGCIRYQKIFEIMLRLRDYDQHIKPGRYKLTDQMNLFQLTDMLVRGLQTPVCISFQNIRSKEEFAQQISRQIETDSLAIISRINDPEYVKKFQVTPETFFAMIIPNTYEVWWNEGADKFLERMYKESQLFWEGQRSILADSIGLTITQIVTLASIVEKETAQDQEKPIIAGVYLNRLQKRWPLQADPTLLFAWNDYSIKRVLNKHKEIDSPYNTYKYPGLPPGPVCVPSIASIDAVLHFNHHDYFYFCAREDFSGFHNFTSSLNEHNKNAERYRKALQRKLIR